MKRKTFLATIIGAITAPFIFKKKADPKTFVAKNDNGYAADGLCTEDKWHPDDFKLYPKQAEKLKPLKLYDDGTK